MKRLLLSVALLAGGNAAAQQPPAPCVFDTAAHSRMDSIDIGLAAGWDRTGHAKLPDDYMAAALAIQAHFRAPQQVRLPLWARIGSRADTLPDESELIGHGLDTEIQFFLSDSGRLVTEQIQMGGSSPDIVISLISAILRTDSAREFLPPSHDVRRAKGAIQLRLVDAPHTAPPSVTLLRIKIPILLLDTPPAFLWMPPVEYPPGVRPSQEGADRVLLELVIGADGRPDSTTIKVVQAAYGELAQEAMRGVKDAHFKPARVAGCPVPVVIRMPIDFQARQ